MATNEIKPSLKEKLYQEMLKDEKLRCTCDESFREYEFHQAEGHYHQCMLYQVARALNKVDKIEAEARADTAKQIFAEIESIKDEYGNPLLDTVYGKDKQYAKLKKKYKVD